MDTTEQTIDTTRANEVDPERPQAIGHRMRTGHPLTGYYVPTADVGITKLIRTCCK